MSRFRWTSSLADEAPAARGEAAVAAAGFQSNQSRVSTQRAWAIGKEGNLMISLRDTSHIPAPPEGLGVLRRDGITMP